MELLNPDVLLFFSGHLEALPIYEALTAHILRAWPGTAVRVGKTQISFYEKHMFACVSFARVLRKSELPPAYLVLTLGLPEMLDSPRIAVRVEPYPGRWTHHIVLSSPEDLDGEMLGWLDRAHAFSQKKRNTRV